MKVGDLVTYGPWYQRNTTGSQRVGVILENDEFTTHWFVLWSGAEPEWECEEDLELLNGT